MKSIVSAPASASRPSTIEKAMAAKVHGATGRCGSHETLAKSVYVNDRLVNAIIERGTAPLGTTSASGWAAELSGNLVGEFLATLAPLSAAAQIMQQGLMVPMSETSEMSLPARTGAPSASVAWVGEGDPIPVRSYTLNANCLLAPRKFGFIVGISREVATRNGGEGVVRQLLREDAAATLDGAYFNAAAGDSDSHAGMLNGVAPITGYSGGDREAMEIDLAALSDAVTAGGSGQVAFVVSPKRAARMRVRAPDLARSLVFLPSLAVADTTAIAVDPLSWAHGFSDAFQIDASEHAVLHMSDDPLPISEGLAADPVRSMWQTNGLAVRLIADVAFAARRTGAAAWATDLTW